MANNKSVKSAETSQSKAISPKTPLGLPHEPCLRIGEGTRFVRAEWLVALLPICLWSLFVFGGYALLTMLVSVVCALGLDILIRFLRRKKGETVAIFDLTPAVTGLLIAFLLPGDAPIWVTVIASLLAAAVGQLFGGMSACPLSLPAFAVIVVRAIFRSQTDMALRFDSEGGRMIADMLRSGEQPNVSIADLLLGRNDGMIGEIAALLILLAAAYLIFRKQISWQIPIMWLLGGALTAYITAPETISLYYYVGAQLLSGGFMLAGCLILPVNTTAPVTSRAGLLIGLLGGILTILFRNWFGIDGALLAVLLCSLPARPLDRLLAPVPFGGRKK